MEERDYTVPEIAAMFQMERSTVVRWCQLGKFPHAYKKLRSNKFGWRVPASDLKPWLEDAPYAGEAFTVSA